MTLFFSFWWLIFPIMGFVFGGFRMWLAYRHSQQAMEILKTYAAQGKDPPPEVMAAVTGAQNGAAPGGYGSPYGGPYGSGAWGGPWGGWGWGWSRWGGWRGPMWAWSRVVTAAAIAIGFAFAGQYYDGDTEAAKAFTLVAIIMGVLAVGFGLMALIQTLFYRNAPKP